MKLTVTVKPRARKTEVVRLDAAHYRVSVTEPADEGRANAAVIEALSDHFDRPKSRFHLVSGHKSRVKIVSLEERE